MKRISHFNALVILMIMFCKCSEAQNNNTPNSKRAPIPISLGGGLWYAHCTENNKTGLVVFPAVRIRPSRLFAIGAKYYTSISGFKTDGDDSLNSKIKDLEISLSYTPNSHFIPDVVLNVDVIYKYSEYKMISSKVLHRVGFGMSGSVSIGGGPFISSQLAILMDPTQTNKNGGYDVGYIVEINVGTWLRGTSIPIAVGYRLEKVINVREFDFSFHALVLNIRYQFSI